MSQPYHASLIIHRNATLQASWHDSAGQGSNPFPLVLPLQAAEMDELRWYLERFVQSADTSDRARARRLEAKIKTWGGRAFEALFQSSEGRDVYHRLMAAARPTRPALLTLVTTDADILGQPWELIRDQRGPLAFRDVIIRRQLRGIRPVAGTLRHLPLRVLLIVSRPTDTEFIDPRASISPVLKALEPLLGGKVRVELCDPPTLTRLGEMVEEARDQQAPFHVVHFDGHGTYQSNTGEGALLFQDDQAKTDRVTATRLGDLLARLDVPLVILEACRGADLSDKPVLGSVAPALLHSGVGSVIAFSHSVHVQASKLFVERFYQELAAGKTVGQALQEARVRLYSEPRRWLNPGRNPDSVELQDWFVPQLYQGGDDPALFAAAREPKTGRDPGHPTRVKPFTSRWKLWGYLLLVLLIAVVLVVLLAWTRTPEFFMEVVSIPAGTFTMGSPDKEEGRETPEEHPDLEMRHDVEITRPFGMGVYPVTVGQFRKFVEATSYKTAAEDDNPEHPNHGGYGFNENTGEHSKKRDPKYTWRNVGWHQDDNHPVVNVTWDDANAFCEWLSRREGKHYDLPTEAQWEYCCRANTTTRFFCGDKDKDLEPFANLADQSYKKWLSHGERTGTSFVPWDDGHPFTAPVRSFERNRWGLYDMQGNVRQWCKDLYDEDYYKVSPRQDPPGPAKALNRRVVRGSSFASPPGGCRSACREGDDPDSRNDDLGFRVVLLSPVGPR
jgi:formylglycine-generating enzyme